MSTSRRVPTTLARAAVGDAGRTSVDGLGSLVAPRSIAVVGASTDRTKLGSIMARSLRAFPGRVALVNPRGIPGASDVNPTVSAAAVRGHIDLVVVCVPAAASVSVVADAASAGAGAALICGGGFAEAGGEGVGYQADLSAVAREAGLRIFGPNTSGIVVPSAGLNASFVPGVETLESGPVAVVAASGGVNHALAFLLADAGVGVSVAAGMGNAVDIGPADMLEHLATDSPVARATKAVALHLESVADGPRLVAAVRRLSERIPVAALVLGRNDVGAFARSHTGALATSWRTTTAALRQAGAVVVDDERALVDAVVSLSRARLTPSARAGVAVVTAQAGPGLLLLDTLRGRGVSVPPLAPGTLSAIEGLLPPLTYQANPVDTGRPGPSFGPVLTVVGGDPAIDVIAAYALVEPDVLDVPAVMDRYRSTSRPESGPPVVFGIGGAGSGPVDIRQALGRQGVPAPADPQGVANGIVALVEDARLRHRQSVPVAEPRRVEVPALGTGPWDEGQTKALLGRLGVATPARRICRDRISAHQALLDLGSPVAVKILDATVTHKSDLGGVHLGVWGASNLDTVLDRLDAVGARHYLVETMAPAGVDLIVGARRDLIFGPVVMVGIGGTTAEVLADVAVRVAPVSGGDVEEMVTSLAAAALLGGWRGGPCLDIASLHGVLNVLAQVLIDQPQVGEVEINPLRVTASGLFALDAVLVAAEPAAVG